MARAGVLFAALFAAALAYASDIAITHAEIETINGIVMLNADAELEFNEDAIDALNSGIPLVFELDIRIDRARKYLWDPQIFATQRRYSLQRHALSEQYVLRDLITDERRVHDSLADAIEELGRVRDVAVVDVKELSDEPSRTYRIRLRLDLEALPAPMIPLAYLSPGWHISSGWYAWQAAR